MLWVYMMRSSQIHGPLHESSYFVSLLTSYFFSLVLLRVSVPFQSSSAEWCWFSLVNTSELSIQLLTFKLVYNFDNWNHQSNCLTLDWQVAIDKSMEQFGVIRKFSIQVSFKLYTFLVSYFNESIPCHLILFECCRIVVPPVSFP